MHQLYIYQDLKDYSTIYENPSKAFDLGVEQFFGLSDIQRECSKFDFLPKYPILPALTFYEELQHKDHFLMLPIFH
jgi:hypothetical protein